MMFRKCFDRLNMSSDSAFFRKTRTLIGVVAALLLVTPFLATGKTADADSSAEVLDLMADAERFEEQAQEALAAEANPPDSGTDSVAVEEGSVVDGQEVEAEVAEENPFVDPAEALVAVRGDVRAGLGVLGTYEGSTVVVTAVSALVGNRYLVVNTADGVELPITGVVAVRGEDMAFLEVDDEGLELPLAELDFDAAFGEKDSVRLLSPAGSLAVSIGKKELGRFAVGGLEEAAYAGAPVVRSGKVVGVFSPARTIGSAPVDSNKDSFIWSDGVVPLHSSAQWEGINLQTMAIERVTLDESFELLGELGSFFGTNRSKETVTLQRLLAAQDRLREGLARATQESVRDSARRSFVFSMRSALSGLGADLEEAQQGFYSYFAPEVEAQIELYRPIREKVRALEANPRSADSYARR